MRLFVMLAMLLACLCTAQEPSSVILPGQPNREPERRLPNGKLQSEAILKSEYEKSMKDIRQLIELSQSLEADMERETSQVISVSDLKKLDEIEKLAKRIRGRIRRF